MITVVGGLGSAKAAIIGTRYVYIERTYSDLDQPAWRYSDRHHHVRGHAFDDAGSSASPPRSEPTVQRRRADGDREEEPIPSPAELETPGSGWASTTVFDAVLARVDALQAELVDASRKRFASRACNPKIYPGQVYDDVVGGEGEVGTFVAEIYRAIGCKVDVFAVEAGPGERGRGAEGAGVVGRSLIYNGHTDVVPPGDPAELEERFAVLRTIDGDRVWGRGATDMKSGISPRPPRRGRSSRAA